MSHCSRKNLHNWHPQASSAETVSIQDCVIFSAISSSRSKWNTACSPHTCTVSIDSVASSEERQRLATRLHPGQPWEGGGLSALELWTAPGTAGPDSAGQPRERRSEERVLETVSHNREGSGAHRAVREWVCHRKNRSRQKQGRG